MSISKQGSESFRNKSSSIREIIEFPVIGSIIQNEDNTFNNLNREYKDELSRRKNDETMFIQPISKRDNTKGPEDYSIQQGQFKISGDRKSYSSNNMLLLNPISLKNMKKSSLGSLKKKKLGVPYSPNLLKVSLIGIKAQNIEPKSFDREDLSMNESCILGKHDVLESQSLISNDFKQVLRKTNNVPHSYTVIQDLAVQLEPNMRIPDSVLSSIDSLEMRDFNNEIDHNSSQGRILKASFNNQQ